MGCYTISLGLAKHDRLKASGVFGGLAVRCLECIPIKVSMLTLERASCTVLRLRVHARLVSLVVGLSFDAPALPPQRGSG
jgi:hypothetical protein